jgi:hypothetical protein
MLGNLHCMLCRCLGLVTCICGHFYITADARNNARKIVDIVVDTNFIIHVTLNE